MAPEQFEGREADVRADIWAFGAVLYEMVNGQKAFQGKSYSTLVGAILAADPPPMSVKPFTPSWLERPVRRCLSKEPENRYHCMRDLVLELRTPPLEAPQTAKPNRWPWVIAAAATTLAIAAVIFSLRKTSEPLTQLKLEVTPPPGRTFTNTGNVGGSAISPDGKTLAFMAGNAKGESLLYLRPIDSLEARALPGLGYTYGTTDNNGNVRTHTVTSDATRKQIELALESDLRQFGPDHPTVAVRRVNLAAVLYSLRDYREALVEIDRALELHRRKLPAGHPHIWGAEEWRETILRAMGG